MLVKIHKSYRTLVAICDSEIIGKKFEEGIMQIDLTGEFFKGDKKSESEVLEIIRDSVMEDATFNIVGEKACSLALKTGIIEKKGIKRISGVPVALVLL